MIEYTFEILEIIKPFVELINLILAAIIVFIGFSVMSNLQGELRKAWNYFLIAIFFFGFHEVIGVLAEFNIFKIGGFYALTEFIFIVFFLFSVYSFRSLFTQVLNNSSRRKIK